MLSLIAFGVSIAVAPRSVSTPLLEWFVVLYFVNFFIIVSFDNPYYDSVHEPGMLVKKIQWYPVLK